MAMKGFGKGSGGVKKSTIVKAANGPLTPSQGLNVGKGSGKTPDQKGFADYKRDAFRKGSRVC